MRIVRGASNRRSSEGWGHARFVRTSSKDAVGLTVTIAYRKQAAVPHGGSGDWPANSSLTA
jgi:hypothetical protein